MIHRPPPPLPPVDSEDNEGKPQTIINLSELKKSAELGQGEFGSVLRGIWKNPNGTEVSIQYWDLFNPIELSPPVTLQCCYCKRSILREDLCFVVSYNCRFVFDFRWTWQ